MYEYADKIASLLNRKIVREFSGIKSLRNFDEINVLEQVSAAYERIYRAASEYFLRLAERAYSDASSASAGIDSGFVRRILSEPDPVRMYVFDSEFDRKRLRLAEAIRASEGSNAEITRSMRLLSSMLALYAVTVADAATVKSYRDSGVERVRWISEEDKKTCRECRSRNGKVYPIDKIPPKPHPNCRCRIEAIENQPSD